MLSRFVGIIHTFKCLFYHHVYFSSLLENCQTEMIFHETITLAKLQIFLISILIHPTIIFRSDKYQIFVISKPTTFRNLVILRLKILCLIFYAAFLLVHGIYLLIWPSRLDTRTKASLSIFSVMIPTATSLMILTLYNPVKVQDMVTLLNLLLKFEQSMSKSTYCEQPKKKMATAIMLLKGLLCVTSICITIFVPIFAVAINAMEPARFPFLGSLLPPINRDVLGNFVGHLTVILFQGWLYYLIAPTFMFVFSNVFLASLFCLYVYVVSVIRYVNI